MSSACHKGQDIESSDADPNKISSTFDHGDQRVTESKLQKDMDDNSEDEYLSAEDNDDSEREEEEGHVLQSELCNRLSSQNLDENHSNDYMCHTNESLHDLDDNCDKVEGHSSDDNENEEDESEEQAEQLEADALESRRKMEENLTSEEKEERKEKSQELKNDGNVKFRNGELDEALEAYSQALDICPLVFQKERSIMFSNRAACKMKKEHYEEAIKDSTSALDLHPTYLKAVLRRAELYEKTEKLDEALADYQKVLELEPSNGMARAACMRLPQQIKDRNEKMKEEMMGKLKDLGNLVLRPFGLSTNNFKLQQDPNSGSYSVQFQQSPPGNGT